MFENKRCFIMDNKYGNCNDFVNEDFTSKFGKVLTLEETVEYQKKFPNKKILVYEETDKNLVEYFKSIGGLISSWIHKESRLC